VNKVVARFADGRMTKGTTADFSPEKELFHMNMADTPPGVMPLAIYVRDLKALYFVKDFAGDPQRADRNEFDPSNPPIMRPISVTFVDGEVLVGTTAGYQSGRQGFFLMPADASSNIERCYVLVAATREIRFL
jgi:hypothetical protein